MPPVLRRWSGLCGVVLTCGLEPDWLTKGTTLEPIGTPPTATICAPYAYVDAPFRGSLVRRVQVAHDVTDIRPQEAVDILDIIVEIRPLFARPLINAMNSVPDRERCRRHDSSPRGMRACDVFMALCKGVIGSTVTSLMPGATGRGRRARADRPRRSWRGARALPDAEPPAHLRRRTAPGSPTADLACATGRRASPGHPAPP